MSLQLIKTVTRDADRQVECYYDDERRTFLVRGSLQGAVVMSKLVFNMVEADLIIDAFIAGTYDNLRHL